MIRTHVAMWFLLASALLFTGCASETAAVINETPEPKVTEAPEKPVAKPVPQKSVVNKPKIQEPPVQSPQKTVVPSKPKAEDLEIVYFEYDSYILTEDARRFLKQHAEWLLKNEAVKATLEGHCDERGTSEYNLALGEKRAAATGEYLLALGVEPGRLEITTFGEERPAFVGHDEEAWKKNRRVEFK